MQSEREIVNRKKVFTPTQAHCCLIPIACCSSAEQNGHRNKISFSANSSFIHLFHRHSANRGMHYSGPDYQMNLTIKVSADVALR